MAYDDNSGDNNNFKIRCTLGAAKDYYLKIRANTYGSFKLNISYLGHLHDYTYRCVSENRDKHTGYCDCGDKKSQNHTFDTVGTKYMCIYCHYLAGSVSGGGISSVGGGSAGEMSIGEDRIYALPEKRETL